jgi:acyl-CoA reductase-like NAD-dependent aldehyde dehydrogenase
MPRLALPMLGRAALYIRNARPGAHGRRLPFGDMRRSGYGRELIGLGIKAFVDHKPIDVVKIDAPF